jgi:hypothetical protein
MERAPHALSSRLNHREHRPADRRWQIRPRFDKSGKVWISRFRALLDKDRTSNGAGTATAFLFGGRTASIFLHKPRVAGSIPAPATYNPR